MTALWHSTILLFGILIGSFLNVCIYRIPRGASVAFPPSHCTKCNHPLKIRDIIPMISYIILQGKCRYCGETISPQYPLIEVLNGLFYVFLFNIFSFSFLFISYAILISLLIVVTWIDLRHQVIPDEVMIFGFIFSLFLHLFHEARFIFNHGIPGFFIGGGVLLLIALLTNGAMGGGDIKLMAMLGFWLGWKNIILIIFFSFFIGAVVSVTLILTKTKRRKDYIPFGPFIALATVTTVFWGESMVKWYFHAF
ncbi:prepilin peptidase [Thermotalea metallivorans]|uniref:Prepilin leader peptidase/N-methyltransferase n=1 Tax=Thermotalea metallivorans TaxID=520762 RepID=A0A140L8A3_9FIRM|nr:A24 family peptidase [Thermotalea metallivorans]KXG76778.1 Type 4 prepilin-like proteins leader peptide-processing enzyme [Thermotalea metallivorans]